MLLVTPVLFPAVTRQNVCSEKKQIILLAEARAGFYLRGAVLAD